MSSRSVFQGTVGLGPLLGLLLACTGDQFSIDDPGGVTWVRLAEYRVGGSAGQRGPFQGQRQTFHYDVRGRLVRWELSGPDETSRMRVSLYTIYRYADNTFGRGVLVGGERFVRKDDVFLKSSEWTYEYDAAGRVTGLKRTGLLYLDFRPTHEEATERYEYDDQDRLSRVVESDGSLHSLTYDSRGDVVGETLRTANGTTLTLTHAYGPGRNPFKSLGFTDSWRQHLSEHDLIRTETRVEGKSGVVSSAEREVAGYTANGFPTGWVQTLVNASTADQPESFAVTLIYTDEADEPGLR